MTVMEGMTAGLELQKYGGTVFISYARADDVKPPFDKATKGGSRSSGTSFGGS
jgi:hypothetical protein